MWAGFIRVGFLTHAIASNHMSVALPGIADQQGPSWALLSPCSLFPCGFLSAATSGYWVFFYDGWLLKGSRQKPSVLLRPWLRSLIASFQSILLVKASPKASMIWGQEKPAPLHGWNNICVTEERKDGGYLRKTSTTISVDAFKNLNTDTALYVHSGWTSAEYVPLH